MPPEVAIALGIEPATLEAPRTARATMPAAKSPHGLWRSASSNGKRPAVCRPGRPEPFSTIGESSDGSRELAFVLECLKANLHPGVPRPLLQSRESAGNLEWVATLAAHHRIRPIVYAAAIAASHSHDAEAPAALAEALRPFAIINAQRSLLLANRLLRMIDLIRSAGIKIAAFKGPILSQQAYGSLGLRETGDLDLLAQQDDLPRVIEILMAHGFCLAHPTCSQAEAAYLQSLDPQRRLHYIQRHGEQHLYDAAEGLNVDLHGALAISSFRLRLSPGRTWSWLTEQTLAGKSCLGFGPEPALLMLCINGAKDGYARLDRICDIAHLLHRQQNMNWEWIIDTAAACGLRRIVGVGLTLAARALGAAISDVAARELMEDRHVQKAAEMAAAKWAKPGGVIDQHMTGRAFLFQLQLRDSWFDRLRLLLGAFEPTVGDWAALPLPPQCAGLHYLLRPMRLLFMAIGVGQKSGELG